METFLIKALQLILSLSILVIVHEFGHFMFARIFKIRVEKFYLFFDAGFSLFKYKPKNSDTEYGIGWLPLGGYVKIAGMVDESLDTEQLKQPEQPWEFRSKPAWQRLLVMVGGVVFNIILAIFIYAMILFAWGDTYTSFKDIKTGMVFSEVAKEAGFQDGDIIINADGKDLKLRTDKTLDMNTLITFMNAKEVVVQRDGELKTIHIPEGFGDQILSSKRMVYEPNLPAIADNIVAGSQAEKAGLLKGDRIVGLAGKEVKSFIDIYAIVADNLGKDISVAYSRGDSVYNTTAYVDSVNKLGIGPMPLDNIMTVNHDKIGFFESFPKGITLAKETLQGYIGQFKYVFTKDGISNLGGFGAIGGLFPATWDWQAFWMMTAFLSVILAVMNILPIPLLDGGHVMFLLYEMITRRKPNEKFMEYATIVGMVLIFGLVIYANGNDIFKAIFK